MIWLQIAEAGELIETAVNANDTLPWLFSVLIIFFSAFVLVGAFLVIKWHLSSKTGSHSHKSIKQTRDIDDVIEDKIEDYFKNKGK